jgi:NitT/TauT family transport system substrate-binding protein
MNEPKKHKPFLALLAAVFTGVVVLGLLVFLGKNRRAPSSPLRVGYQPTMLYLPLFVAKEKGFFEKKAVSVQLVRFTSANDMAQALATGQLDATGMSSLTVLGNLEANSPNLFRMYLFEALTTKHSPDALVVKADSSIRKLEDLRGKKLGVNPGTTLQSYVEPILRKRIGPNHNVSVVPLAPNLQVQALASGNVDALFVLEPVPTVAQVELKARVVETALLARYIHEPFYAGAGVFARQIVEKEPEKATRFRAAMRNAIDYMTTNEVEARQTLEKYANVSPEVAKQMQLVEWVEPANVSLPDWEKCLLVLEELELIPKGTNLKQHFYGK